MLDLHCPKGAWVQPQQLQDGGRDLGGLDPDGFDLTPTYRPVGYGGGTWSLRVGCVGALDRLVVPQRPALETAAPEDDRQDDQGHGCDRKGNPELRDQRLVAGELALPSPKARRP